MPNELGNIQSPAQEELNSDEYIERQFRCLSAMTDEQLEQVEAFHEAHIAMVHEVRMMRDPKAVQQRTMLQ